MKVDAVKLETFTREVLAKVGVPDADAAIVSECLVHANLSGVDTHGVVRLPHYIRRLKNGTIRCEAKPTITHHTSSFAVVDGDDGLGHTVMYQACRWGAETAKKHGTAAIAVKNSSHFGMTGYYISKLAEMDLASMAVTTSDAFQIPFGARKPFWGTNPIAIGFPTNDIPLILDMATTSIPYGKIVLAQKAGESIPEEWGYDDQGKPTTDPDKIVGLHPIAGPKGSGLAMVIDIFCNMFTALPFGPHINKMYGEMNEKRQLGHFLTVWDPGVISDVGEFKARMDAMIREYHELAPAGGFTEVLFPGELEGKRRRERRESGVPLEAGVLQDLVELGESLGILFPKDE